MINRFRILLDQPEYEALLQLSDQELRSPADQARLIVRLELIRLGLLPDAAPTTPATQEQNITHESTC